MTRLGPKTLYIIELSGSLRPTSSSTLMRTYRLCIVVLIEAFKIAVTQKGRSAFAGSRSLQIICGENRDVDGYVDGVFAEYLKVITTQRHLFTLSL